MATTYSIDTGDGDQLCAGLQGYDAARKAAQRRANELGQTVYLYAPSEVREAEERGEEHESEAIEPEPRKVLLRTGTVGQHFGTCGVIHDVRTGQRLAEGMTRPYGFTAAALADVEAIADERRYVVLTDEEAIECGINPETGVRFDDEEDE